jgi:hypothetical protein
MSALTKALAILDRGNEERLVVKAQPASPVALPLQAITAIDLPRICGLHGRPWFARYVRDDRGRWEYLQSVKLTPSREEQYRNSAPEAFAVEWLGYEVCAWCGGYNDEWVGAVECGGCNRVWCQSVVVNDYFRCPCGHRGKVIASKLPDHGLRPSLGSGGMAGR